MTIEYTLVSTNTMGPSKSVCLIRNSEFGKMFEGDGKSVRINRVCIINDSLRYVTQV